MKKYYLIVSIFIVLIFIFLYGEQKVAVLGYHYFATDEEYQKGTINDPLVLNINKFEEQLKYLKNNNYKTLTLDEFYCYHEKKCKIPRKSVLITMDDGYQSNYDLAFPLLKKYEMNAVVFYVGSNDSLNLPAYMKLETLKKIKKEYPNIEIASHSYKLHERGAVHKGKKYLEEDFSKMKKIVKTKYFAYPYGDYNKEVLKEEKYKMAFTFGPKKNHRKARRCDDDYEIPRLNICNQMPMWKFILRLKLPF